MNIHRKKWVRVILHIRSAGVVVVLVVGPISTPAMKVYCTLTPIDFRHSSSRGAAHQAA
jgi:hypothetical protein